MGEPRKADLEEANTDKNKATKDDKTIQWNRSCTDIICCIIFLAFLAAIVIVGATAFGQGNPLKIITPFDSVGNQCGFTKQCNKWPAKDCAAPGDKLRDFSLYKYKFMYKLQTHLSKVGNQKYYAVCVKECPETSDKVPKITPVCMTNPVSDKEFGAGKCPPHIGIPYTGLGGNCVPKVSGKMAKEIILKLVSSMEKSSGFARYIIELQYCKEILIGMAVGTIVVSIIYIFLLKWITKPLLYISMLLILVGFVLVGAFCWYQRGQQDKKLAEAIKANVGTKPPNKGAEDYYRKNITYFTVGAIAAWVLALIYICFMCCCWSNISLGASIMEAASDFVAGNLRILLLPIAAYFVCIPFIAYWFVSAVFLWSIGEVKWKQNSFFAQIVWDAKTRYMWYFYLFAFLWVISFFICMQQFIIAATVCQWYFTGGGNEDAVMSDCPYTASVWRSFKWGMFWNCGSIAFGSFLIALITFIRLVFEYFAKKYEAMGQGGALYKCVSCYMRYILCMLDKYIKFMTKNAFIQVALTSCSFCSGAFKSFYLIVRNMGRFSSAAVIGWIMMILGKGTIVGTCVWLTYFLTLKFAKDVTQPILPAVLIGLVAYFVGSLFLSVFSFSCTAILHCFILDEDTGGDDSMTPESLVSFIDKVAPDRGKALKENIKGRKKGEKGSGDITKLPDEPKDANTMK